MPEMISSGLVFSGIAALVLVIWLRSRIRDINQYERAVVVTLPVELPRMLDRVGVASMGDRA